LLVREGGGPVELEAGRRPSRDGGTGTSIAGELQGDVRPYRGDGPVQSHHHTGQQQRTGSPAHFHQTLEHAHVPLRPWVGDNSSRLQHRPPFASVGTANRTARGLTPPGAVPWGRRSPVAPD